MKSIRDAVMEHNGIWPDDRYNYLFTTGPEWNGGRHCVGEFRVATYDGFKGSKSLIMGSTAWVRVCSRQEFEDYKPEKGRLPPVGTHCEITWGARVRWYECIVLPDQAVIIKETIGNSGWRTHSQNIPDDVEFRPLRTGRDRAINAAYRSLPLEQFPSDSVGWQGSARRIIGALYDAGKLSENNNG